MNNGISFGNVHMLIYIPICIGVLILLSIISISHRKKIEAWINPALWPQIIPSYSKKIFKLKKAFLSFSLIFFLIALARPQWGQTDEVIQTRGMDIFFLLDLSNSMLAEDASPSRLGRAQTFIKKTLLQIENDRVGIIGFAGTAQLSVPLTTDFQYISEIIDTLDPNAIPNQGTNVADAFDAAARALERSGEDVNKNSRALILITDGEDFGESASQAAKKIKEFGTGFYAFSVGSTDGAPIPLRNESGVLQTYKKTAQGKPILSRVNKDFIAKITEDAGGEFFELVNPEDAAYRLSKQLQKLNRGNKQEQHVITKIERFEWFLLVGIIFLFLYLGMGYRKEKLFFIVCVVLGFSLVNRPAEASETNSIKSYLKQKEGENKFEDKKFEESAKAFQNSQENDQDNSAIQYNQGTALANAGKLEEAISELQAATQKALNQADFATAAKSLFNEGIAQAENKNNKEAFDRITKSIEMSKISNQPDIEKKAREALTRMAIKQKEEQQKKNEKEDKDKKENQKEGEKKKDSGGDKDKDKKPGEKEDSKNKDENQGPKDVAKKREFRSGTLSKDTAESIMNDLSDREKQLYHQRLKGKKGAGSTNGNDW